MVAFDERELGERIGAVEMVFFTLLRIGESILILPKIVR